MKKGKIYFIVLIMLAGLACNFSGFSLSKNLEKEAAPGEVLFSDTFSDDSGGWNTWTDNNSIVDYNSGGLRFYINEKDYNFWSRPQNDFQDVMVEVLATRVSGTDDNHFGVICHYENRDNYYALVISSDGYYGIIKVLQGSYHLLNDHTLQYSEAIKQGGETNHIQALCSGSELTLTVNGEELASVQDSDISSGGVGLITASYETPGVDILFDNFVVYKY